MYSAPPSGITPPAPGLEREEPDLMVEDDIPSDDGSERETEAIAREGETLRDVERE
jgi:hypothetical protein